MPRIVTVNANDKQQAGWPKMTDIAFSRDFDARPGEAVPLSPLIRRIVCDNPGPFTYKGTSTYLIGRGPVAVIDPGPDDEAHLQAILDAVAGETVSHILITHTHRDHSPLAARLKAVTGARTYAEGPHGGGRRDDGALRLDAAGDHDFIPDVRLADGDVVEGSGFHLEAVFTPGHTANHMAFALKEENALFSGDHVMAWSTSVIAPPDGNMAQYFSSLRKLIGRDETVYWPGHGPERRQPQNFVRAFLSHRQMREAAILQRIKAGDTTIAEIVKTVYANVDPRLHGAAALSTFAHIEHLIEQGKVWTDGEASLDAVYSAAEGKL
jgi:glyoxylase-like metal-dependent hydrolase (beta-lactamase superfamily II)